MRAQNYLWVTSIGSNKTIMPYAIMGKKAYIGVGVVALIAGVAAHRVVYIERDLADWKEIAVMGLLTKMKIAMSKLKQWLGYGHYTMNLRNDYLENMPRQEQEVPSGVRLREVEFNGVSVRIYDRVGRPDNSGALVWMHGGGWFVGHAEEDDFICFEVLTKINILIVNIEYRRAPEHPYPAPFDDCYRAVVHFIKHAGDFSVDPNRIAVGGQSAGANLAAAVALKARSEGLKLKLQVLVVPCLQAFDFTTPSYQENEHNMILSKSIMVDSWLLYAKGLDLLHLDHELSKNEHTSKQVKREKYASYVDHGLIDDKFRDYSKYSGKGVNVGNEEIWNSIKATFTDPYFAPLMADDLSELPEAYIITAQYDVLRDDGIMYAKRLEKAGVKVTHMHYNGTIHPVFRYFPRFKTSAKCKDDLLSFLEKTL